MSKHRPPRNGFRNKILKRLPAAVIGRLRKGMRLVELTQWDPLYEPHETCKYVYFPESGMASILSVLKDGTMTEVGTVGSEGMGRVAGFFRRENQRAARLLAGPGQRVSHGCGGAEKRNA